MTLDDIFELWSKDSKIDEDRLDKEAISIPQLHHKYYKIYSTEGLKYVKMEHDYKRLKLSKTEFYTLGDDSVVEDSWETTELPAQGRVIRNDLQLYMDADQDIINLSLKMSYQKEKLNALESIIKTISNRGFHIKSAVDFIRFTSGI